MYFISKNFLLLLNQQFSSSAKNEYKLVAERRAAARREARNSFTNSNWRCILNIARMNFGFRAAARGGARENQSARRLRRMLSKLPKNWKNIGSNHILGRTKENFSYSFLLQK